MSVGPSTVSVWRSFLLGGSDSRHSSAWRVDCSCQVLGSKIGLGNLTIAAAGCPRGSICMMAALVQSWDSCSPDSNPQIQGSWEGAGCLAASPAELQTSNRLLRRRRGPTNPEAILRFLRRNFPARSGFSFLKPAFHLLTSFPTSSSVCRLPPTFAPVGLCLSRTLSSHSSGPGRGVGSTKSSPVYLGIRAKCDTGYWWGAPGSPSVKGPQGSPLPDGPHTRLPIDAHTSCARVWAGLPTQLRQIHRGRPCPACGAGWPRLDSLPVQLSPCPTPRPRQHLRIPPPFIPHLPMPGSQKTPRPNPEGEWHPAQGHGI